MILKYETPSCVDTSIYFKISFILFIFWIDLLWSGNFFLSKETILKHLYNKLGLLEHEKMLDK